MLFDIDKIRLSNLYTSNSKEYNKNKSYELGGIYGL
jgi:hypothetical protein